MFRKYNGTIWFLLVGIMVSKAAYFISMPYLAILLKRTLQVDPVSIGLILGIGPFVGILGGFYVGYLSDIVGRKWILITTGFLWGLSFLGFAYATELWHYALLNTLNGLCSAAHQPVSSALVSDLTKPEDRKSVFHLRYFMINLGATVGPLFGASLLILDASIGFVLTSVVYLIYALACIWKIPADGARKVQNASTSFKSTLQALSEDIPLLIYTFAFVLMGITYS